VLDLALLFRSAACTSHCTTRMMASRAGPLEHISRNPEAPAGEPESRITAEDRAEWVKGSIDDWVLEGHRLARAVRLRRPGHERPGSHHRRI
jgi:hypothetical protein